MQKSKCKMALPGSRVGAGKFFCICVLHFPFSIDTHVRGT
jgi:hypothetical protein